MIGEEASFKTLFEQLGLEASDTAIEDFIHQHQLAADTNIVDAPYWNDGQRQFLSQKLIADDNWAILVDALNEQLHLDAHKS